jgi:hypothetical protein
MQSTVSKVLVLLTDEGVIERSKPKPPGYPTTVQKGVKWRRKKA